MDILWSTWVKDITDIVTRLWGQTAAEVSDSLRLSPNLQWGDLAWPVFNLAKRLEMSPAAVTTILSEELTKLSWVQTAQATGPYVNIKVQPSQLFRASVAAVLASNGEYGCQKLQPTPGPIIIEYCSPNTNKPLHLGHLRNITLGDSLTRLLRCQGQTVITANHINDRGVHIMKSLLAYQKWGQKETPAASGLKGDHLVGKYYILFSQKAISDSSLELEVQALLRQWEAGDPEVRALTSQLNDWAIDGLTKTYQTLKLNFDEVTLESEIYLEGKKIVERGVAQGVFQRRSDGAVVVDLTEVGLGEKVLLRPDGTSVYITQDLALALKRHLGHPDLGGIIYVVAREQEYHFKVLFEILRRLGFKWAENCFHFSYGMVNLPTGRMKSREGTVVDADSLIADLVNLAQAEVVKRWPDLPSDQVTSRAAAIGLAGLKYYLLRSSHRQDMVYDPQASISFDGMTGSYLQYTHARLASILKDQPQPKMGDFSILGATEERAIALNLMHYPSILSKASQERDLSILAQYCYELAQNLNVFYQCQRVLQAETDELRQARLALVWAGKSVLAQALDLLGIEAPEEM